MKGKLSDKQIHSLGRELVGFFKWNKARTLDEIAGALVKFGVVTSLDDARLVIPQLCGKTLSCDNHQGIHRLYISPLKYDFEIPTPEPIKQEYQVVYR